MAFLEICNIHKTYGSNEVLKGIDLTLEKGQVMAIIGASGNGKTTLLRCLNFLTLADEGCIKVDGQTIFDASIKYSDKELRKNRFHMGLVFQGYNLFPHYTVLKNTYIAPILRLRERHFDTREERKAAKQTIKDQAQQYLERMSLQNEINKYPCQLSGGQSQRAAIARALMLSPSVLCFDEPTSALDPKLTSEVLNVIRSLKEEGRTMIVVTHEMAFAASCADKIVYLHEGRVGEEGGPEIISNPKTELLKEFLLYSQQE